MEGVVALLLLMFKNRQYTPTAKEFKEEFCINGKWVLNSEISYNILLKEEQQRNERFTKNIRRTNSTKRSNNRKNR